MDVNFVIITLWIVVLNDFKARSQSVWLKRQVIAIQGSEYTLTCVTNIRNVKWYKGDDYIGYSDNQGNYCYMYQDYSEFYKFKDCGVKHELTIKSIDYDRDNGGVWECYNEQNILRTFTMHVINSIAIYSLSESAIHGQNFVLRCNTYNIISNVKWYRNGQELVVGNTEDGCVYRSNYLYQYESKTCGSIYYLKITSVNYSRDNNLKFQCRTNSYSSDIYTLQVKVLPKFTISSSPIVGQSFDLTCFSTYPVSWFRKTSDEKIDRYIGTSSVSKYGCSVNSDYISDFEFKSCGSVFQILTVTSVDFDRDNGSTWRCETTNRQSSDSYTMIVIAPVTSVEIKSTNLNSSILSVEESRQFVIQCVTSFAYPEPTVDLFICNGLKNECGTYTTNKSGKTKTAITFQVLLNSSLKLDDTRVYCSARNTLPGINSTSVTLYILHHPKIRVQADDGNLLCIAEGRPENMTFLPWKHSIDNKLVREIEGYYINTTVYSLNITNNQSDGGNYTCTVYNGIPDPVTKQLDQMTSYQLNLHVEPSLYNVESSNNLQVGNNGGFSFEYLQDNTVNVSWNRDGQKLENNSRITISEEPTEISHPYNNNIKLSGIKTTLTITSINITDQGNYICDICNQYGCSHRIFELNVALLKKQTNEDAVIDVNTTIIVASVVSTVILICVVVVIFIAILRRRTKSNGPSVEKRETDYNRQNTSADNPVEMEIIENDLYISSDLLDNENTKEPPVYTQVKKTSKNETTYDNNVPSDNFPEYGIVQKKKGKDKTKNHDKDIVYYNTSSEAVSSAASDFNNVEADPYINAEYLNRKQLEIRNS